MKRKSGWLRTYTLGYIALAALACAIFALNGKSAVWKPDGYYQSYTAFEYISALVRSILSGTDVKMVDFSLGQGLDVISTLSYYGLFDPINALIAAASGGAPEFGYAAVILIKTYLAGLFFALFCEKSGVKTGWATACAALTYAFSGFMLYAAVRHPLFINGPMYLPLMLLAADNALRGRRTWLLPACTALMLITNFYFAYMNTLFTIAFIIAKLIPLLRGQGAKIAARAGFRALFGYLIGAGLSAAAFLPVITAYMGNGRLDSGIVNTVSLFHYDWEYYGGLALFLGLPRATAGYWTLLNFAPPTLMAVFALSQAEKPARRAFIILFLCLCVPLFGKIMNGFGYVTNRWCYALTFAACVCAAQALPKLAELPARRKKSAIITTAVYLAICAAAMAVQSDWALILPMAAIAGFAYVIFYMKKLRAACAILSLMAFLTYTYAFTGYLDEFADAGVRDEISDETAAAARDIDDSGFYRVAQALSEDSHASMLAYNGVGHYWSIIPGETFTHLQALELSRMRAAAWFKGFGGRAELDALAAVKYWLGAPGERPPYGFEYVKSYENTSIYANKNALPIGYLFESYMLFESYYELSALEKQSALTQAAVVESPVEGMREAEFSCAAVEIPVAVSAEGGAQLSKTGMTLTGSGAVTLEFEAPEDCDIYVAIDNLRLAEDSEADWLEWRAVYDGNISNYFLMSNRNLFGYAQRGALIRAGESGSGTCRLEFDVPDNTASAEYTDIRVFCAPHADYDARMTALRARGLTDVSVSANRVSGAINTDGGGVLQLAIPYSKGWSAFVDGERAETFLCGGMYTGVRLGPGAHEIVLKYETPGLRLGFRVSGASIIALIIYLWIDKRMGVKA